MSNRRKPVRRGKRHVNRSKHAGNARLTIIVLTFFVIILLVDGGYLER